MKQSVHSLSADSDLYRIGKIESTVLKILVIKDIIEKNAHLYGEEEIKKLKKEPRTAQELGIKLVSHTKTTNFDNYMKLMTTKRSVYSDGLEHDVVGLPSSKDLPLKWIGIFGQCKKCFFDQLRLCNTVCS